MSNVTNLLNFETYNFSSNVTKNTYSQIMQANEENDGDLACVLPAKPFII